MAATVHGVDHADGEDVARRLTGGGAESVDLHRPAADVARRRVAAQRRRLRVEDEPRWERLSVATRYLRPTNRTVNVTFPPSPSSIVIHQVFISVCQVYL